MSEGIAREFEKIAPAEDSKKKPSRVLLEPHAHTKEVSPCGWLPARELIELLHGKRYSAVVITDHMIPGRGETREKREAFLAGYRAAKAAGEACGVTVLPGMEIRFQEKNEDFLVYGMEEEDILDLPDGVCEMGIHAFHELAAQKEWMIYQAHPFRAKMLPANPSDIDGMETFNGNPRHNSQNRLATRFAMLHSLRSIAGSDIHQAGDVGAAGLLVPGTALTPKGLAAWLRATPHPRVQYQEPPTSSGIRYMADAIPGKAMLQALYRDAGWFNQADMMDEVIRGMRGGGRIVTAWDDTTLIGVAHAIGDGHTMLVVQNVCVLGSFRRRGVGRGLMRRLLAPYAGVRQVLLVANDSPEARSFFTACGFDDVKKYGCTGFVQVR